MTDTLDLACACACARVPPPSLCVCSHLSVVGVLSTIGCTYSGFSLLAVAVIWNGNLIKKLGKIREQWRALRGRA